MKYIEANEITIDSHNLEDEDHPTFEVNKTSRITKDELIIFDGNIYSAYKTWGALATYTYNVADASVTRLVDNTDIADLDITCYDGSDGENPLTVVYVVGAMADGTVYHNYWQYVGTNAESVDFDALSGTEPSPSIFTKVNGGYRNELLEPSSDSIYWKGHGAVNSLRLFDRFINTQAHRNDEIRYDLTVTGNSLALFSVIADNISLYIVDTVNTVTPITGTFTFNYVNSTVISSESLVGITAGMQVEITDSINNNRTLTIVSMIDEYTFTVYESGFITTEVATVGVTLTYHNWKLYEYKELFSSNIVDWNDFFYGNLLYNTDILFETNMNINANIRLEFRKVAQEVKVGSIVMGRKATLGVTLLNPSFGIDDYSTKDIDTDGNVYLKQGNFSKRATMQVLVENKLLDSIFARLIELRGQAVVWIGDDDDGDYYNGLMVYGFYQNFEMNIPNAVLSEYSLEIKGLI